MFGKKGQGKIDEFAFVLLAGIILIVILMIVWSTPTEAPPVVEAPPMPLTIPINLSSSFELTIKGKLTNVTLSSTGEIRDWISFSKNDFDVSESDIVTVTVKVPNVLARIYTGNIIVKSSGGEKRVSVSIEVTEVVTREFSNTTYLGDFEVSYTVGTETLDSKENFEVSAGYLSSYPKNLVGVLEQEKLDIVTDAYIQLVVEETNAAGNLIVLFNDQEVLKRKVSLGEVLIPIEKSLVKRSNTVAIKAGMPGWMFWMSTVYRFNSAKLVVNYEGVFSKEITFNLDQEEVENFDRFHLVYRVKDYSKPLPEMMIKLNNQIAFSQQPPLAFFNATFNKDILGNKLLLNIGNNTISFLFEEEASYEITNAILTVYYLGLD